MLSKKNPQTKDWKFTNYISILTVQYMKNKTLINFSYQRFCDIHQTTVFPSMETNLGWLEFTQEVLDTEV